MKHNHLKNISGAKIRRQYFSFLIYMLFSVLIAVVEVVTFVPLFRDNFDFNKWVEDVFTSVFIAAIFIVPCIVFALINRFLFGKIVCVLNEEGIHYKDGLVKWCDILCIEYNITAVGRFHFRPSYIAVVCKKRTIQIESVPLYMFSVAKQFDSDIKTRIEKMFWIIVVAIIILPIIISAVV